MIGKAACFWLKSNFHFLLPLARKFIVFYYSYFFILLYKKTELLFYLKLLLKTHSFFKAANAKQK